jgi:pyruvate,water dikinase
VGEARHAARARAGAGRDRRSGHRDALGHHAREPRSWLSPGGDSQRDRVSPPRAAWSKARARRASVEENLAAQPGDILVCQVTNPTWAPIFQKIAAAVSDIGGSMSHAAIVAREYGLPAVVGTASATSRIRDGQRIRVDGGRGIVTLLQ